MKLVLSLSDSLKRLEPMNSVMQKQQALNTKTSLIRLSKRFAKTFLGKELRDLSARDKTQNQILMSLEFGIDISSDEILNVKTLLKQYDLEPKTRKQSLDSPVGKLVCFYAAKTRSIRVLVLDQQNKKVCSVQAKDYRYRPTHLSMEIYGAYLLNLFRMVVKDHSIYRSYPSILLRSAL